MACLNPLYIENPAKDPKLILSKAYQTHILVPCGRCFECRKANSSAWRARLIKHTELNSWKNAFFITLTIKPDYYTTDFISSPQKYIRLFLERYRARYGKSLNHWFVTELGSKTGRLHFHGLIYDFAPHLVGSIPKSCTAKQYEPIHSRACRLLRALWKYGDVVHIGNTVTGQTANYIVKYIRKPKIFDLNKMPELPRAMLDYLDKLKKDSLRNTGKANDLTKFYYRSQVFCSPKIGEAYLSDKSNIFIHKTYQQFTMDISGFKYSLPRYYRDKIFSFEELEERRYQLMINPPPLLFKGITYQDYDSLCMAKYSYYLDSLRRNMSVKPNCYRNTLFGIYERAGRFVRSQFREFTFLKQAMSIPFIICPFWKINDSARQLQLDVIGSDYSHYLN